MKLDHTKSAVVTGGASGLGRATVERLVAARVPTVILDLPASAGAEVAAELGSDATFVPADVTDPDSVQRALDAAQKLAPLRIVVHCAGRGGTVRVVENDGRPGSLQDFESILRLNVVGSFNMLRLGAAVMASNEVEDAERGAVVMTASAAAYEGQVGQIPYATSKAGVVGMTLVAARDLAKYQIRVCSIAPGVFDTPILNRFSQEMKDGLARNVVNPRRLGHPDEFAMMAIQLLENPYVNGETIRLDGALRMPPK